MIKPSAESLERLREWARRWRFDHAQFVDCPKIDANAVADLEVVVQELINEARDAALEEAARKMEHPLVPTSVPAGIRALKKEPS